MDLDKIKQIFREISEVKLAYLFGSQATGKTGPLSDYDFAVYLDEELTDFEMFDIKTKLLDRIGRSLKTDKVDVVVLNQTEKPELKYHVIKDGQLIHEEEPYRLLVEPKILNLYFDFMTGLQKNNLTSVKPDDT